MQMVLQLVKNQYSILIRLYLYAHTSFIEGLMKYSCYYTLNAVSIIAACSLACTLEKPVAVAALGSRLITPY